MSYKKIHSQKFQDETHEREKASEAYEEYLLLLQQRNRILKKLKEKNEKQLDLEKREQGFSLYLNGANVGLHLSGNHRSRKTKTAGESTRETPIEDEPEIRAKTAPNKQTRRGWNESPPDKIKIKTKEGTKLTVDLPENVSGKYEEDFEVYQSFLATKLEEEEDDDDCDENRYSDEESDGEDDNDDDHNGDNDGEGLDQQLTFTVEDLKTLRASLEMDSSIRKSIAEVEEDMSSSDSDDDGDEEDDRCCDENADRNDRTGIELEEIEEEVEADGLDVSQIMTMKDISEEIIEPDLSQNESDHRSESIKDEIVEEIQEFGKQDPSENKDKDITFEVERSSSPSFDLKTDTKCIELSGAAPKSRPVTASRRKVDNYSVTASVMSDDLASAIEEENRRLNEYKGQRELKSAPVKQARTLPSEKIEERPQTIQGSLSTEDISSITDRVRKMTGRQQRKLLKMLAELEEAEQTQKELQGLNITESEKDKLLREQKNKRKLCSLPVAFGEPSHVEHQVDEIEYEFLKRNVCEAPTMSQKIIKHESDPSFEIRFEFGTNWGSSDYIGLTEIQLLKDNNHRVRLHSKDIKVISAHAHTSTDEIKNVINHKTKTTKDRYMWKANHTDNDCLKILMTVSKLSPEDIYKIVIWNYNKNLQDLNIGVKDCEIFIDDKKIWMGVIDKGCGNQIFDYSKVIQLKEDVTQPTLAKETLQFQDMTIKASISSSLDSNTPKSSLNVDSSLSMTRPSTRTIDRSGDNSRQLPVIDVENVDRDSKSKVWTSPREEPSPPKIKKSTAGGSKPVWLTESGKPKQPATDADDYIDDSLRPRSRPSSGRRSQQQQHKQSSGDDLFEEKHKPPRSRPSSGRRSQLSDHQSSPSPDLQSDKGGENKDELDVLFDLNSLPRRTRGAVSTMDSIDSQKSLQYDRPTLVDASHGEGKSERQLFKEMMDVHLEQSLRSIDNFNSHHLGRIEANLNDDDIIGSYLEQMKPEDHHKLIHESEDDNLSSTSEVEENEEDEIDEDSPRFEIPLLPKGKELIINIKSTWGDKHYVGLNGIEVFTATGGLAPIKSIQANPADINILPEYEGDPRVVNNLMDGCFLTRDDLHLWLTPYTSGGDHLVAMEFEEEIAVSMIRIWNYNKSRIHSSRGARFVEMALDGKLIFIGEIARASGVLSAEDPYGDTILFTTDEDILELVAEHDQMYEVDADDDEDQLAASFDIAKRPATGNEEENDDKFRPFTAPKSRENSREGGQRSSNTPPSSNKTLESKLKNNLSLEKKASEEEGFLECKNLCIFFTATWGDLHYLGLTGLEVLGETFEPISLTMDMLDAIPRDLNDLDDYDDDDRTLENLINGVNVTMSDENMWMIPFDDEGSHILKITFDEPTIVTGLRVWNYNKSLEDTYRGAKVINVYMDEREVSPENGFLLRKGPGHCHFDYAQDILFNQPDDVDDDSRSLIRQRKVNLRKIIDEYESVVMPCGFVFQLRLFSSWGDQYYVGLNGIEVFDQYGRSIPLTDNNITAFPHSCNVLDGVTDDVRTPEKLVDGVNDTYDGRHMWLSPIFPGQLNLVYIVFDQPVTVSMIKIWNYSKTPPRGVRQFGLLVDDLLVYSGVLPQPALFSRGIIPGVQVPVHHHTILFTDAEDIATKEKGHLLSSSISMDEQAVTLTNDRSVLKSHKDKYAKGTPNQAMRPMTSVTSRK